jgi:hypothetical protein
MAITKKVFSRAVWSAVIYAPRGQAIAATMFLVGASADHIASTAVANRVRLSRELGREGQGMLAL